jgi:hypothetical protein
MEGAPGSGTGTGLAPGATAAPGSGASPGAEVTPGAGATTPSAPVAGAESLGSDLFADAVATGAPGFGGGLGASSEIFPMIGDMSPFRFQSAGSSRLPAPPPPPGPRGAALFYPTVRNIKISENQSPRPQDRIFFDFNYYNNVNAAVNRAERTPISNMMAYTYLFGFEKTFDSGRGSIGLRLPLNSLTASADNPSLSTPTSTALGNLNIFTKYILKQNVETGSLISAGLAISPQTATSRFAGAPYVNPLNTTYIQPFIGYIWNFDRFYLQGFSGFDFPVNNADVSLMYNDIGVGYWLYRNSDRSRFLTAIAPTFEVHVNSPLNHRNPFNGFDPAASANTTNLTYGLNFLFRGRAVLTAALVTPVSSPKPFDAEFALLFNFYFGRTARNPLAVQPPIVQ